MHGELDKQNVSFQHSSDVSVENIKIESKFRRHIFLLTNFLLIELSSDRKFKRILFLHRSTVFDIPESSALQFLF